MKRKKIDYNYWTNYKLKRKIAILLTAITPIIASGCNADKETQEEVTTSHTYIDEGYDLDKDITSDIVLEDVVENNDDIIQIDDKFENVDDNQNVNTEDIIIADESIDLEKLNNIIKEIKNVNYISHNNDFNNYDIYGKPQRELDIIKENNLLNKYKPSDYNINYNWYNNGKVDSELLYKKIIANNKKAGIKITDKCDSVARMVADVLQNNIDLLKKKNPNFNFNIAFYNIDTLTVNSSTEEWYYSLYVYDFNRILVNFDGINSEIFFRSTVSHEVFHLMFNGATSLEDIYIQSTGIDTLSTEERPLEQNFMNEYFVEKFSYEAFNDKMSIYSYDNEKKHIDLLCMSTGKDEKYFENCIASFNRNALVNCFEEEFRNVNFAFSTYFAFDKSCYYGDFPENCDMLKFKESSFEYGAFNLLKNAYVRVIKEYSAGKINKDQAKEQLDEMKNAIENIQYISDDLQQSISQLDEIYYSYINSKVK